MCGIAGISIEKPNSRLQKKILEMKNLLSHRGPDSSGEFHSSYVSLIHTRLSIIDLDGGNQPIENNDMILVANGEIYNDLEIRKTIKKYKYKTNSDSESIMAAYYEFGLSGLKKLRGMYAFALYDKKTEQTILGRDDFGIKPLYFSMITEGVIFSSEISAIVKLGVKCFDLSKFKFLEFLQLQYCSGNRTIYENILRIRPGETLVIQKGKIIRSILNEFLEKKNTIKKKITKDYTTDALMESVSVHLRSDVPYCVFFSGGIDSTLVLYFMSLLKLNKISAYTIGFNGMNSNFDQNLKVLASKFNVEFTKINFDQNDFWNLLPFAAQNIDEPIADYAILPTFKLAREASKNFKVVLTGEGGDELFGGYGRYRSLMKTFFKKKKKYTNGAFSNLGFFKQYREFWDFDLKKIDQKTENLEISELQKYQLFDYFNWLPNDLLVKLDRCLMTYGVEGRTPLVDKELFKKFFYVEDKIKIKKNYGKFFIREFLESKLNFYNPYAKKEGFTVPISEWIPEKSRYLEEFLPKIDILKMFFKKSDLVDLCRSVKTNKRLVKPLWHLIFFSIWHLANESEIDISGNYFDVISECR